ncbi:MAG: hypothetical protein IKZ58_06270 [Selenomonadaceae bacterium]|nr:hypothetical protein [Selenomonadaceae bacterium]
MLSPHDSIPLPHDTSMELELLGSLCLKDGLIIPKVASILKPDDFYSPVHKLIYQTILDLFQRGIAPNMLLIFNDIKKHKLFKDNEFVFKETVLSLGEVAFTTAYSIQQANVIKDFSIRRQMLFLASKLQRDFSDSSLDTQKLLVDTESAFRIINDNAAPPSLITPTFYLNNRITRDIEKNKLYSTRVTGFSNIDLNQIFSPGLYVVGATPAAGKTTFCWQLLDQLAHNGESCIFCSYEMSALELYSKSLSKQLFLQDRSSTLTSSDIRRGAHSDSFESLLIQLCSDKNLKGVNLFELRDESVDDMLRLIKPFCSDKSKSPVVCLDYLQIVPSVTSDNYFSNRMRIDDIVHKLKTFQRETNTTFIVVSSFNRDNYAKPVSFESFKESGNIEYSADVVWALQLNVVNNLKGDNISDARKKIEGAKKEQPRHVQLKCLKNRQGNNYDCFFYYFSAHDYFEPCNVFNSVDTNLNIDHKKEF